MSQYREDVQNKNLDVSVVYAGESVQYINEIQPAETIIRNICMEAENLLG